MRAFLDSLYRLSGALAAIGMVATLVLVTSGVVTRPLGIYLPGTDDYAGYAMAACGFFALAYTFKHGEPARDALLKAAAAAEERGWKVSEEKTAWYIEQLKANKMKVQPAPEALQAELLKVGEKMTAEWVEKAGPDGQAILDAYRKLK